MLKVQPPNRLLFAWYGIIVLWALSAFIIIANAGLVSTTIILYFIILCIGSSIVVLPLFKGKTRNVLVNNEKGKEFVVNYAWDALGWFTLHYLFPGRIFTLGKEILLQKLFWTEHISYKDFSMKRTNQSSAVLSELAYTIIFRNKKSFIIFTSTEQLEAFQKELASKGISF